MGITFIAVSKEKINILNIMYQILKLTNSSLIRDK